MSGLEAVAALLVLVSVYLSTRENIWSWPTAIVAVLLYGVVFWQARFYAGVGLQVCFAVISAFGWYNWLYGGTNRTELRVTRITARVVGTSLILWAVGSVLLGWILLRYATNPTLPWLDSALSVGSLLAQWMLTRKIVENWLVWMVANLCYVGMYFYQQLTITAGLYLVLFFLAAKGYVEWRGAARSEKGEARREK